MPPIEIHCSTLPRILRCPASAVPPKVRIEQEIEASLLGSAVHQALAKHVRGEETDIPEIAEQMGVNLDELRILTAMGRQMWAQVSDSLKVLAVEDVWTAPLDDEHVLSGTADVVAEELLSEKPTLVVWDWKTGRVNRDYRAQVLGYAQLAWAQWPEAERIKVVIAWVRDRMLDVEEVEAYDLHDWQRRLYRSLAELDRYAPSPEACEFCPRAHECEARQAQARADALVLAEAHERLAELTPGELAALKPKADLLRQVLRGYDEALKAAVRKAGTLPTGDGRELYMEERTRMEIDFNAARPTLREVLGCADDAELVERLAGCLALPKTPFLQQVAASAPRGAKGKRKAEVMAALEANGAVKKSSYEVLSVRKEAGNEAKALGNGN